jgi:hypothetical protein
MRIGCCPASLTSQAANRNHHENVVREKLDESNARGSGSVRRWSQASTATNTLQPTRTPPLIALLLELLGSTTLEARTLAGRESRLT